MRRRGGSVGGGWRRGGRSPSSSAVASETLRTARSKASSERAETEATPLTLRTNWRAAASTSAGVAAGSRPRKVVMLRHMSSLRLPLARVAEVGALCPETCPFYGPSASDAGLPEPAVDLVLQLVAAPFAVQVAILLVSQRRTPAGHSRL